MELDDQMSKTQMSRQCGIQGIPKELQFMYSEVSMEIPDDVQGTDNIVAGSRACFLKGIRPTCRCNVYRYPVLSLAGYTKAYFTFLKTPDIVHGLCGAEAE